MEAPTAPYSMWEGGSVGSKASVLCVCVHGQFGKPLVYEITQAISYSNKLERCSGVTMPLDLKGEICFWLPRGFLC